MNSLLHWLTSPEWSQVVKTLLHSLWQGALIVAALVLMMRRLANPQARYRCSLVALAAIPVAGIVTWAILSSFNHQPPLSPLPISAEAASPPNLIPLNQGPVTKLIVFADHTAAPPQSRWTAWLALAWLIGAITMLGRVGAKVAGAERLRRACQPLDHPQIAQLVTEARQAVGLVRKIRVAVTDKLTSPAVVGVLVPTLILPLTLVTTLTPEQIHFILLHELAHIRRGDYFANLFQLFVEALLFFNPAVWWISHQVRREREACCDALAIELSGAPADYARTLVHVAESTLNSTLDAAPAFGGGGETSSLSDRVQRLLVPGYRPSLRLTWRAMIAAFVLGAALLVLSAEGTRVAVAQITKTPAQTADEKANSPQRDEQSVEAALPSSGSLDYFDPTHWPLDPNLRSAAGPADNAIQVDRQWFWDHVSDENHAPQLIPLPRNRLPFLGDLPFVGKLFVSQHANSGNAEYLQLFQLSALSQSTRGAYNVTDSLIARSRDTAVGSDIIQLPLQNRQLARSGIPLHSSASSQSEKTSPSENSIELSGYFTNEFKLGEPIAPSYIGPRIPAKLLMTNSSELGRVRRNLRDLRFKFVSCSNKPLENLFRELVDESKILDPEGNGFRFLVVPFYLNSSAVTINPPLTNANLLEILAAIQGIPRLQVTRLDGKGWMTLKPDAPPVTLDYDVSQSELEADQQKPYGSNNHSAQTNPPNLEITALNGTGQVDYNLADGKVVITNGGLVRFKDTLVRADAIELDRRSGQLIASGNVRIEMPSGVTESVVTVMNIYSNAPLSMVSTTNLIYTGESRRAMMNKLTQIQLDRVYFNETPLSSVIGHLQQESWRRDPDGLSITFVFNHHLKPKVIKSPDDLLDLFDTRVTINPPLTNVSVLDALQAIVKGAAKPIRFGIDENAVVISAGKEITPLFMREYKVGPVFFDQLREAGYSIDVAASTSLETNSESVRRFFTDSGVDLPSTEGKSVFCNHNLGVLLVRATMDELNHVEQLLTKLNKPEPQINIKVRFVEIDMATVKNFGSLDIFLGTIPPAKSVAGKADEPAFPKSSSSHSVVGNSPSQLMGILSDPQYRVVLRVFEQREGAEVLALQEVTTVSGRQAQMQTVEIKTVVTDINPKALAPPGINSTNKGGSGESLFITTNLSFGPIIDIVPAITPDGYSIAMTVIPRMTEFLGYDGVEHPTNTVTVYENGKKGKATYPSPRLRTQQMTNNAVVRDGMTLMLGAPPVERTIRFKDKVPVLGDIPGVGKLFRSEKAQVRTNALLIFITPTIVDPAGNRTSTPATNKSGADESFQTSSNLFPIIDRPIIH